MFNMSAEINIDPEIVVAISDMISEGGPVSLTPVSDHLDRPPVSDSRPLVKGLPHELVAEIKGDQGLKPNRVW